MNGTETGRLAPLLRWLGLTLVVILLLQMVAVLVGVDWSADAPRPQVTGPLVALAPLGFAGLLICLIGSRLDHPEQQRSPLRLLIAVLSGLLALGMVIAVPMSMDGGAGDVARMRNLDQADQQASKPQGSQGHQRASDLRAGSIRAPVDANENSHHLQQKNHHKGQAKPPQQGCKASCLSAVHRENAE